MLKRTTLLVLAAFIFQLSVAAQTLTEQQYRNQLEYRRDKLELVTKKRLVDEKRSYSNTDINTTSYSWEAYTFSDTDISTSNLQRSEVKEINEWYVVKGGVKTLSDLEFAKLVDDRRTAQKILEKEKQRSKNQFFGNVMIGVGLVGMIGSAALSAGQAPITISALVTTGGFFISAFNQPPEHYIQPDYAQKKIDEYNISLKKKLELPLDFN